ncbi:hypothetical protein DPV78_012884 [Talaromyces pinophilus]|nr:hypothetical protein DPV78_012884 [Talaromyces pinophilus]
MSSLNQQSHGTGNVEMSDRYSNVHFSLIIRRYLDPEGNLSLQDAVGLIYRMLPEKVDESTGSNMDRGLFENDILQLSAETPYNDKTQFRLAKFGYAIHKPWEDIRVTLNNKHPWNFERYGVANAQVNMHAFIARLTCLGAIFPIDAPWPIWTLRDALEEEQGGRWDAQLVSSAAMWIICAGQWVFNQIGLYSGPQPKGWHKAIWSRGSLYEGPLAGLERWKFWHTRFVEAANSGSISYECRGHAHKAGELMKSFALNAM